MEEDTQCIIGQLSDITNLLRRVAAQGDEALAIAKRNRTSMKYAVYEGTLRALEEHAKRHPVHPYPMIYKERPITTCGEPGAVIHVDDPKGFVSNAWLRGANENDVVCHKDEQCGYCVACCS